MATQLIDHENGGLSPPPEGVSGSQEELSELLRVLFAMRDGDFSIRLPGHWTGLV